MARLPIPGQDEGEWGNILNEYLQVQHDTDGKHKLNLSDLTDVSAGTVSNGQVLKFDGTSWSAQDDAAGSGDPALGGDLSGTASNATVVNNVITNAHIANTAAIDQSKISGLIAALDGKMNVGDSGDPTLGGDLSGTASNATIINSVIMDAHVAANAAIAQSKIAGLIAALDSKMNVSDGGTAGGTATLGPDGTLEEDQIPATVAKDDEVAATYETKAVVATKADKSAVVHISTIQTITGAKDFTGGLTVNGDNVIVEGDSRLSDQRVPVDGSVTTAKLADGSVTQPKIAAAAPTAGQFLSWTGTELDWVDDPTGGNQYIVGDGVAKMTVGSAAPTSPQIGDVWIAT